MITGARSANQKIVAYTSPPGPYSWALLLGLTPEHYSLAVLLGLNPGPYSWASFEEIL